MKKADRVKDAIDPDDSFGEILINKAGGDFYLSGNWKKVYAETDVEAEQEQQDEN